MVVSQGNYFWRLDNGVWRVIGTMTRAGGWTNEAPRKKDSSGKIIQYSTRDWFQAKRGDPGSSSWNPGDEGGFKGNKALAWTKGIVGVLTGDEKIVDAAIHGDTNDFLRAGSTMSDVQLGVDLSILGAGVVGGIAAGRMGGGAKAGGKPNFKITKEQLRAEAKAQKINIDKVSESQLAEFVKEYNARDPIENVENADTILKGKVDKAQKSYNDHIKTEPGGRGSLARARYNVYEATRKSLQAALDSANLRFSKVRRILLKLKADRRIRQGETKEKNLKAAREKFERDHKLEKMEYMDYLRVYKKIYDKNPEQATFTSEFIPKYNKFRLDFSKIDVDVRMAAEENYKAAKIDPEATYFRIWEDIKSKNRGEINIKTFEDQVKTESLEARNSARASRIKQFENQHGLKNMSIQDYITEYKKQYPNKGPPTRLQLKDFMKEWNDYRIDMNSISESVKGEIVENYHKGGESPADFFEEWKINKNRGGDLKSFEEALKEDSRKSRDAADEVEVDLGLDKVDFDKDGILTREEVKKFNKQFDFDEDGILNTEEQAAKDTRLASEEYEGLSPEERRLLEDDEVEVDLFGEEPARRSGAGGEEGKSGSGKVAKGVGAGAGAGAVAGGVAAAVSGGGDGGDGDGDDSRLDNFSANRRMIEFNLYDILIDFFQNPYYYPSSTKKVFNSEELSQFDQYVNPTDDQLFVDSKPGNPFDVPTQEQAILSDQVFHPDINKKKALELLHFSSDVYSDVVESNAKLIADKSQYGLYDTEVKVYTEGLRKVVAFRGTSSSGDVLTDINTTQVKLSNYFDFITINDDLSGHMGFISGVAGVYEDIKKELEGVVNFEICGHSMGSGLASIFLYVYHLDTGKQPLHAFGFGGPRVFAGDVSNYNKKVDFVRFQNLNDPFTFMPTNDVSLNGFAGAVVGGLAGYLAKPQGAGSLPAMGGAIMGLKSSSFVQQDYKHVGLGILLTGGVNEVLNLGSDPTNPGQRVVPDPYIYIEEGKDILRNPLDVQGEVVKNVFKTIIGAGVQEFVLNRGALADPLYQELFKQYDGKQDFLGKAYGVYQRFLDTHNVLLGNNLSQDLLTKLTEKRREFLARGGQFPRGQSGGEVVPFARLTAEYFTNYQRALKQLTTKFVSEYPDPMSPFYQTAENVAVEHPKYYLYSYYHNKLLNDFLKAQELEDMFQLRDALTRFHLYDLVTSVSSISNVLSGINKVATLESHQTLNYGKNIELLPDVLYAGQNVPDKIKEDKDSLETYRRNWDFKHHRHYYDLGGNGHYINNFNRLIPANKILGFYFYKDPSVLNKLVIF